MLGDIFHSSEDDEDLPKSGCAQDEVNQDADGEETDNVEGDNHNDGQTSDDAGTVNEVIIPNAHSVKRKVWIRPRQDLFFYKNILSGLKA